MTPWYYLVTHHLSSLFFDNCSITQNYWAIPWLVVLGSNNSSSGMILSKTAQNLQMQKASCTRMHFARTRKSSLGELQQRLHTGNVLQCLNAWKSEGYNLHETCREFNQSQTSLSGPWHQKANFERHSPVQTALDSVCLQLLQNDSNITVWWQADLSYKERTSKYLQIFL